LIEVSELDGKRFTVWLTDEAEESVIFAGTARRNGLVLSVDRGSLPPFEVRAEWFERIRPVNDQESRKILLGAEYVLHLWVGNLAEDENKDRYLHTGLKWPD
jgi:hypothetical protein